MDVYSEIAEFYDLIYYDRYDLEFYLNEARNARGPVLEIGCGTGRIMLKMLQEGIDVTGIDLSQKMLDVLKSKAKSMGLYPKAFVGDMRTFKLDNEFNLIVIPYRSFLHLLNDGDRKIALLNFQKHLKKGGRLIIHTYNPSEFDLSLSEGFHHIDAENLKAQDGTPYSIDWYLDFDRKKNIANYRIVLKKLEKEHSFEMTISHLPVKEMKMLLEKTGFKNVKCFCGFNYSDFNGKCNEVLWFAEK